MLLFCTHPVLSHSLFDSNAILSSKSFFIQFLIHHQSSPPKQDQRGRERPMTNGEKIEIEYRETKKHIYIFQEHIPSDIVPLCCV